MRQPLVARVVIALMTVLAGSMVAAAQAAPLAQPPTPEQGAAPARIAVVHAAPFATDSTVTVVANDLLLLDNTFEFGEQISYVTVPTGTYEIDVYVGSLTLAETAAATPALTQSLTVAEGTDYTVIAIGTNTVAYPLELLVLDDTTEPPASATAKLRVVHAAPFGATPNDTAVDVIPDTGGPSLIPATLEPFIYGEESGFLTVPSGIAFNLKVVADGTTDPALIDLPEVTFNAGDIATVIAVGGANGYDASYILLPFAERAPAQVRLVHAAPFAAGSATVTVALNGQVVTNSLDFRDITPYKSVEAGIYTATVHVGASATGTPALTVPLLLQDGGKYTVVAIGTNTAAYPLKLVVISDDETPAGSATARVRVLHAAPFAPTPAQTAVDVVADDGTPIPGLTNIVYEEVRANITVPSGIELDLQVVPAGQPTAAPVIDLDPITFSAGGAYTVIAVGGANGQPGSVLLLDDLAQTFYLYAPIAAR